MKSGWILGIGAFFCAGVVALSRIWLPYGDSGVSDGMLNHVAATTALIVSIGLSFGYFALGFASDSSTDTQEAYGSVVTGTYLVIGVLITAGLFARTYYGLSYSMFWTAQIFLYGVLCVVWVVSTKAVVPMAAAREANARIVGIRKQGINDGLNNVAIALKKIDSNAARSLKKAVDNLQDEVKFFPNHATGADAESIVAELNNLVQQLSDLNGTNHKDVNAVEVVESFDQMTLKVKAAQRHVAQWKRD